MAWTAGVKLCECDVAVTSDGQIVLGHDADYDRLALKVALDPHPQPGPSPSPLTLTLNLSLTLNPHPNPTPDPNPTPHPHPHHHPHPHPHPNPTIPLTLHPALQVPGAEEETTRGLKVGSL